MCAALCLWWWGVGWNNWDGWDECDNWDVRRLGRIPEHLDHPELPAYLASPDFHEPTHQKRCLHEASKMCYNAHS